MAGIRTIRQLKSWLENEDNYIKIGWYSEKQRNCMWHIMRINKDCNHTCANVYLTPEGKEVIVTEVTDGLEMNSTWDDMKMVGPIIKWKRGIYNMHITFKEIEDSNCKGIEDLKCKKNDDLICEETDKKDTIGSTIHKSNSNFD